MTTNAALEWRDGLPYSTEFDDTYFSVSPDNPQHGLAETRHVFLQHNQLQQRWQNLPIDKPSHFVIVETGFGSGLNFLASLQLWREVAPQSAHLHFVSIEIAPFSLHDLQQAHAHFPELAEASLALCKQYRFLQPGINQLELSDFSTSLTLHIADAASVLPGLDLKADAWFLDGFAP
ncbi:MAG: tRNA (5-methylaminomethyl-2-thiouridine)(34)-methyltransferase MnmD, partial [Methylophilus sp.]